MQRFNSSPDELKLGLWASPVKGSKAAEDTCHGVLDHIGSI